MFVLCLLYPEAIYIEHSLGLHAHRTYLVSTCSRYRSINQALQSKLRDAHQSYLETLGIDAQSQKYHEVQGPAIGCFGASLAPKEMPSRNAASGFRRVPKNLSVLYAAF